MFGILDRFVRSFFCPKQNRFTVLGALILYACIAVAIFTFLGDRIK